MTTISSHLLLLAAITILVAGIYTVSAENEIYESRGIKSGNGADKRPFFVGSRYGRSQPDISNMDTKTSMGRIVPRNDRFFFGSRYGKRSTVPISATDEDNNNQPLSCFYTGVTNLFRCVEQTIDEQK
ncbi:hypothetical protein PVAND_007765 [Polypedilum vanderplanki]|uniref:RYamide n=1 Tax=Polypedilum vanderplanki TaxID=319348 RepID=A0A9J6C7Y6_POLVA|nr:hypothetical protein PVAND_007765 [Polypedilum vanderplanki]